MTAININTIVLRYRWIEIFLTLTKNIKIESEFNLYLLDSGIIELRKAKA